MSNPLSTFFAFLKRQMPGAPSEHFAEAEKALAAHVRDEVAAIETQLRKEVAAGFDAFKAEVLGEVDKVLAEAGLARTPSAASAANTGTGDTAPLQPGSPAQSAA